MTKRFEDEEYIIEHFSYKFLVRCSRCEACAIVIVKDDGHATGRGPDLFAPRRLICSKCGLSKEWAEKTITRFANRDWYFKLPLWLQAPCCGETLWALNEEHLAYLESFVEAELRGERRNHHSIITRLPVWLKLAKNRAEILKCIARLKATLE